MCVVTTFTELVLMNGNKWAGLLSPHANSRRGYPLFHFGIIKTKSKDVSMVKPGFKSVPPQLDFEFTSLFLALLVQKKNGKF